MISGLSDLCEYSWVRRSGAAIFPTGVYNISTFESSSCNCYKYVEHVNLSGTFWYFRLAMDISLFKVGKASN